MFAHVEVSPEEVEARIASTCGALNRLYGELVDLVAECLRRKLWCVEGIRSPEHWVQWRTGLSPAHVAELVRIARRREELPVCTESLRTGSMSIDQLDTVARHVPEVHDADVVEIARTTTVNQLRRVLSKMPFTDDEPTSPAAEAEVHTTTDCHGRFELRAAGPADEGAVIRQALTEAREALFRAGRATVTDWDALVEMAHRSLDTVPRGRRRDRYRVYVHLDTEGAWLTSGPRLPKHLIDQMTCDGTIRPVWETDARPVSLGRTSRAVPTDLRRLVLDRDRGCRHPGCTNRRFLDIHHLVHWRDGGSTDADNLVALCGMHHRSHHDGNLSVSGHADRPDGLVFRNRHGVRITGPAPRPPEGPPPPGEPYPGPLGERFASRWWILPERPPPSAA